MKKFRFSLETVLKVRRQNEETRIRELAVAQGERDRALMLLAATEKGLKDLLRDFSASREGGIDLAREAWYTSSWAKLGYLIFHAKADLARKEAVLEERRLKAVEASRERLALEKLEAKQLQEHLFQINREEQGLLDDLAQRTVSAFSLPPASA